MQYAIISTKTAAFRVLLSLEYVCCAPFFVPNSPSSFPTSQPLYITASSQVHSITRDEGDGQLGCEGGRRTDFESVSGWVCRNVKRLSRTASWRRRTRKTRMTMKTLRTIAVSCRSYSVREDDIDGWKLKSTREGSETGEDMETEWDKGALKKAMRGRGCGTNTLWRLSSRNGRNREGTEHLDGDTGFWGRLTSVWLLPGWSSWYDRSSLFAWSAIAGVVAGDSESSRCGFNRRGWSVIIVGSIQHCRRLSHRSGLQVRM